MLASFTTAQYKPEKIIEKDGKLFLANTVVVKLKGNSLYKSSSALSLPYEAAKGIKDFKLVGTRQKFSCNDERNTSLSSIVEIKYSSKEDPVKVAETIRQSGEVVWAEPHYVYTTDFTPDDELYNDQWSLEAISAASAWDITKGDKKVIIAIVDTGVDWDHPDLAAHIWKNMKEIPGNGIDDDKNGFVDDVNGWDFGGLEGNPDNNPMEDRPDHGTHVAGIAGAVSDNGVGVASIGYSVTIMPVKTTMDGYRGPTGGPYIVYGFEGIIYAADNGANIINCSWGGDDYSEAGREAIEYATSKGALVIAAAGNNSSGGKYYPACYDGVFSVASTNKGDIKSDFSNYGELIGVSAPGKSIKSTWQDNTYEVFSGTSMAAPLVAGLAGLVKSLHPDYTPLQIAQQIRVNADNIDNLNPGYEYMLGTGRINAYKALKNNNSVSVRSYEMNILDEVRGGNGNGIFEPGEIITIGFKYYNILSAFNSMSVQIASADTNIEILNNNFNISSTGASEYFDNYSVPFRIKIKDYVPKNYKLSFLLKYSADGYSDFEWKDILINQTYQTISTGKVEMTVASEGNIGFNDFWKNTQGIGFKYNGGANILYEGAFMFGNSASRISNSARGVTDKDSSFKMIKPFWIDKNNPLADEEGTAIFNDDGEGENKLGITAILKSYSWLTEPYNSFVILNYKLVNNNDKQIENLFAGLYFDWNMLSSDATGDIVNYDENNYLGYAYKMGGTTKTYAGCSFLNGDKCNFYAISNSGGDGGIGVYAGGGGFTRDEKWLALSNGIKKRTAENADVSFVISGGPYIIKSNDTLNVAFAVAAGYGLDGLKDAVNKAREKYKIISGNITSVEDDNTLNPLSFELGQNYPNPFNPYTTIKVQVPYEVFTEIKLYDILGREVKTIYSGLLSAGLHNIKLDASELASGTYIYRIKSGDFTSSKKLVVLK
jgi:subtilisin family serine protease